MPSSDKQEEINRLIHELADAVVNYGGYADDVHESDVRSQLRDDLEVGIRHALDAPVFPSPEFDRAHGIDLQRAAQEALQRGSSGQWAIHARGEHNIGYVPEATSEAVAVERFMKTHPLIVLLMGLREHQVTATRIAVPSSKRDATAAIPALDWRERCFRILDGVGDAEGVIFENDWVLPDADRKEIVAEYMEWKKTHGSAEYMEGS